MRLCATFLLAVNPLYSRPWGCVRHRQKGLRALVSHLVVELIIRAVEVQASASRTNYVIWMTKRAIWVTTLHTWQKSVWPSALFVCNNNEAKTSGTCLTECSAHFLTRACLNVAHTQLQLACLRVTACTATWRSASVTCCVWLLLWSRSALSSRLFQSKPKRKVTEK